MKFSIISLNHSKTSEFLHSMFDGCANFVRQIIQDSMIQKGKFYCLAIPILNDKELHEFEYAKDDEIGDIYVGDIILYFLNTCLNERRLQHPTLIIESATFTKDDGFIKNSNLEYYLANDSVFFKIESPTTTKIIEKSFIHAQGWGFLPFLIDTKISDIAVFENIDISVEKEISNNACMFFAPIYDDESYLFWIKDGYEHLLDLMHNAIIFYNA